MENPNVRRVIGCCKSGERLPRTTTVMTLVGLVGGLGPESTIDYYRRIFDGWRRDAPDSSPNIIIDSLDTTIALRLVASDRAALVEYLFASINRLQRAGADFVAMTANTPHIVFDEL